jgi:hypothetical protein
MTETPLPVSVPTQLPISQLLVAALLALPLLSGNLNQELAFIAELTKLKTRMECANALVIDPSIMEQLVNHVLTIYLYGMGKNVSHVRLQLISTTIPRHVQCALKDWFM